MQEAGAKRRRGILVNDHNTVRHAAAVKLCVLVVAMVTAQQSFFPIGSAHVILLLVPVALASLLLGKWQGCAIGALAGAAEMLHSLYLPYDFYEMYFASPINSIVLFALFGLIMGGLLALACRLPHRSPTKEGKSSTHGIARVVAIVGACVADTLTFRMSVFKIN